MWSLSDVPRGWVGNINQPGGDKIMGHALYDDYHSLGDDSLSSS